MQDTNGNQIALTYNAGQQLTGTNSSSRIQNIEDVRGAGVPHYTFTYAKDVNGNPHLTAITNSIGTAEKYSFLYAQNQALTAPFSPYTSFGSRTFLNQITTGPNLNTQVC